MDLQLQEMKQGSTFVLDFFGCEVERHFLIQVFFTQTLTDTSMSHYHDVMK